MFSFPKIEPSRVVQRLKFLIQDSRHSANEHEIANVVVQWPQLSVIFCEAGDIHSPNSTVRFRDRPNGAFQSYSIPSSVALREHLLFVSYSTLSRQLVVLGDLTFRAYQLLIEEHHHIRISDLDSAESFLVYRDNPWEIKFLDAGRRFSSYAGFLDLDPDATFIDLPRETRMDALANTYDEVLWGLRAGLQTMEPEELYDYLVGLQLDRETRPASFYYGCLLGALSSDFLVEFQSVEVSKMSQLFVLFYNTELKRMAFCQTWLPAVTIYRPRSRDQFYGMPDQCTAEHEISQLELLQTRHRLKYPDLPAPGIYFRSRLSDAPGLLSDLTLPVSNGLIYFTHYELFHFVETHLLEAIDRQVAYLRFRFNLHLAERFTIPMLMERRWQNSLNQEIRLKLGEIHSHEKSEFLDGLMIAFTQLLKQRKKGSLLLTAMELVAGFNNCLGLEDGFPVWPLKRALSLNDEGFYEQHPELVSLHSERVPSTYEELVEESNRYWPPCMQRMAAGRVGDNHMQHDQRVRMAALIRTLGYLEPQGVELWRLLFERTRIYTGPANFFQSAQGIVILYDYRRNKQNDIGVSCRALVSKRFCPFAPASGQLQDIEELTKGCQQQCKAQFGEQNPGWYMPHTRVKSPRDYFFQARNAFRIDEEED